jgi:Ca2+-binding RTX toxin-like protein
MSFQLQTLETRLFLSGTVELLQDGTLLVRGTPQDDTVTAQWTPGGMTTITVTLNDTPATFNSNDVRKIKVSFGAGDDDLRFGGAIWRPMVVKLGEGDDHAFTGGKSDIVHGGAGNDTVNGSAGDDTIYGGDGNDVLEGAEGNDLVRGGAGDDRIGGWSGRNRLYGDDGNDTLIATSRGSGVLIGGAGDDVAYSIGTGWSVRQIERSTR